MRPGAFPTLLLMAGLMIAGCDRGAPPAPCPLKLVVSGDTQSWITPCGCASNQSGGLMRRGTYLRQAAGGAAVVYADAGGAIDGTSDYHRIKFEAILRGEMRMGLAAHNIGAGEAALGPATLRELSQRLGVPLVSANVTDSEGRAIAPGWRIAEAGGRRVALVGLMSQRYAVEGVRVEAPAAHLAAAIDAIGAQADAIIVLGYMPEEELVALAESTPEVHAVVGGPTHQAIAPRRAGPALVASATNKGKFLVEIDLSDDPSGRIVEMDGAFADDPEQLANLQHYLADLAARDFSAAQTGLVQPLPPGAPADYRFAGNASCRSCHDADHHRFAQSKHAHAFDTLKYNGMHVDPNCLQCHTTGFALPGGFATAAQTPHMLGVGCESCHGPSAAHVANPMVKTPFAAADQCIRCHDQENSPTFDYATYWPKIQHGQTQSAGAWHRPGGP